MSYQRDIKPIIQRSCTPCHFPARGRKVMLNTHTAVVENIDEIMKRTQLSSLDEGFMPFKSKREPLSKEEIELFKMWIAENMPK